MATQQVSIPSLPVVLVESAEEHKIYPIPFQKKHFLVDFKRTCGYADPSGSPTYGGLPAPATPRAPPSHGTSQP